MRKFNYNKEQIEKMRECMLDGIDLQSAIAENDKWIKTRPSIIQQIYTKVQPGNLYRIKTGEIGYIYSFFDDGTISMYIFTEHFIDGRRAVYLSYGIDPNDLEIV